ncbi:MAG TPA: hypothetical protein VIJ95_10970 [Hanamia sp.]
MIKEEKNIDFYTTGRQPSEEEFARIGECIRKDKVKQRIDFENPVEVEDVVEPTSREGGFDVPGN